tara:strand:+ start:88 stop:1647 length:1560 start_codon:yes stop_codon:yes gene_type:complete
MRKNFKVLIKIIVLFFFSVELHAKSLCETYYENLYQAKYDRELFYVPVTDSYKSMGFALKQIYDSKLDDNEGGWRNKYNEDGYPYVGHLETTDAIEKIKDGDLIIKINDKDIRDFDLEKDETLFEILKESLNENNNKILLQNTKGEKYLYDMDLVELESMDYYYDIYLKYIKINDKESTFDVTMNMEFTASLSSDFQLYKIAKDILIDKNEDGSVFNYYECDYKLEDWSKLDNIRPDYGIVFPDLVSSDKSLQEEYYLVEPRLDLDEKDKIVDENSELLIHYNFTGTKSFRNNFNLQTFPFDKQTLKIFLRQDRYAIEGAQTIPSDYTVRELERFASKKTPIQGWNIVGYQLNYKPSYDVNEGYWSDGIEFDITVERKSRYYVFKIILPIILILTVCWSAIYITPREIESRLTITIVCLLSLIAYNFVIDSDLPKLEYLTVMDYIILLSYLYAAIPNFLSIYSHQRIISNSKVKPIDLEPFGKKYGILSYIFLVIFIIILNTNLSPENTSAALNWMSVR